MHAVFTYGGSRKSSLTPTTIVFGAYAPTSAYDSIASVGPLPLSPEAAAAMADVQTLASVAAVNGRISQINVAIANLTAFEKQTRAYYDARVSRTSGGKRDRLRRERADLCNQALAEIALLKSAHASATRLATTLATVAQDDYNPATGVAMTPAERAIAVQQKAAAPATFNMNSLIIPAGAALAAIYFLKGN
jgi:hypothetical protein